MPIYEYKCTKCDHTLEALQKMSDPPLRKCPECGKRSLEKLVSAASFRLKGGGWYETDFKTGDKKQLADSDSVPVASSKSDDKPAKPAETSKVESPKKAPEAASKSSSKSGKDKSGTGKKAGSAKARK